MAIEPISSGFGDYDLPKHQDFLQMQRAAKVQAIAFAVLFGLLTVTSLALIPLSTPLAVTGALLFSGLCIKSILTAVGVANQAPPTQNLFTREVRAAIPALGEVSPKPCSGFATRDGIESHQEKLKLIRLARESIVLSGCYCGARAFDETLDLIRDQMRLKDHLTTSILASDWFITEENKKRIESLENEFGERFCCLVTPEPYSYVSPTDGQFSTSINHTKALVIDYGAAFLIGGSGIVSPWSEQTGEKEPNQVESHGLIYDALAMKAYRDMDFVFYSSTKDGPGARLYVEMAKLVERFRYAKEGIQKAPAPPQWIELLPLEPMPGKIDDLKVACYAAGPETADTSFLNEIIAQVNKAQTSLIINHMYFHPTEKLLRALIDASNRGVKITLMTNKWGSQSPGSHMSYAELSRYYAKALFEGKEKPNIELYEYDVPFTTLHKKVILIDGKTTLTGSSNIGEKSLEARDYEINLKIESEDYAERVTQLLEEDKRFCQKDQTADIPLKTRLYSSLQSLCTSFL